MLTYFNRLSKAVSVAALTFAVAFGAQSAQKASAQVVTGAGSSSVTTLLRSDSGPVIDYATSFGYPYRYVITGSGAGRTAFLNGQTDFVATDGLGTSFGAGTSVQNNTIVDASGNPVIDPFTGQPYVVVNEAFLNVAHPVNLGGSGISLSVSQACDIINGNVTNWSEVGGSDLPIRRVARGDSSGTAAILHSRFVIPFCGNPIANPPVDASGQSILPNARLAGSIDPFSGEDDSDIIVFSPADPFTGDDVNGGSYNLGVINTIQNTLGAFGYAETAVANSVGATLAVNAETGQSTFAVGPTYVIFRADYFDDTKNAAAQTVCYGAVFSGFLSQAGFSVDSSSFPYNPANSPQAGADTDNYGSLGVNDPADFGPCSTIGS